MHGAAEGAETHAARASRTEGRVVAAGRLGYGLKGVDARDEALGRLSRHIADSRGRARVLEVGQTFETVEGVVKGIGLHDELEGSMYLAVEGRDAAVYYVPVRPEVAEGLRAEDW